jgi:hypothetical protein
MPTLHAARVGSAAREAREEQQRIFTMDDPSLGGEGGEAAAGGGGARSQPSGSGGEPSRPAISFAHVSKMGYASGFNAPHLAVRAPHLYDEVLGTLVLGRSSTNVGRSAHETPLQKIECDFRSVVGSVETNRWAESVCVRGRESK